MTQYYHDKYLKYKYKYNMLKKSKNETWIVHSPLQFKNIIGILNDGIIKLGSDIPEDFLNLSGKQKLPYIFARFYFHDIPETYVHWNLLVFDEMIFQDYEIFFNIGWKSNIDSTSLKFSPDDSKSNRNKKINLAKKIIMKSDSKLEPTIMNHELIFTKPIKIKKYLRAIILNPKNKKENKIIHEIINDKYPHVIIHYDLKNLA